MEVPFNTLLNLDVWTFLPLSFALDEDVFQLDKRRKDATQRYSYKMRGLNYASESLFRIALDWSANTVKITVDKIDIAWLWTFVVKNARTIFLEINYLNC